LDVSVMEKGISARSTQNKLFILVSRV
jgi:hypothetical protein